MTTKKSRTKKTGNNRPVRKAWSHLGGGRRRPGEAAFDATILLRLYAEDRKTILRAAEKAGMSLSGFLRERAVTAANEVLGTPSPPGS